MIQAAYLDSIAALTATRDSQALAAALVRIVQGYAPHARVVLLDLAKDTAAASNPHAPNNAIAVTPEPAVADPILSQCLRTRALTRAPNRLLIPICDIHEVGSVLSFAGELPHDITFIEYLLRIYQNQRFLMGKGEIDALTGLKNRQAFDERMKKILSTPEHDRRGQEIRDGVCFAIADIDYFKQVNDKYGHLYGDEVLLLFAQLMGRSFRQRDLLFRYGGEEFAIVLGHKLEIAMLALQRFRETVANFNFPQIGYKTVSIGVVEIKQQDLLSSVIDKADKALYYAKNNGRNQVCAYEQLREAGLVADTQQTGEVELF